MEITNLDLQNQINSMKQTILETIYPVGSVYMSFAEIGSPERILGFGTWELIKDKFLLAAYNIAPEANMTGGGETHQHNLYAGNEDGCTAIARFDFGTMNMLFDETSDGVSFVPTESIAHNQTSVPSNMDPRPQAIALDGLTGRESNLPPYISVYIWKRTA